MQGLPYEVKALLQKARESALLAVETYNRPTASFRTGAYTVLMIIAWTSLFHAMFIRKGDKPYYRMPNSRRYQKIDGDYKRWELMECLQQYYGGNNPAVRKNLEFFVGLRNRIEHCSLAQLDPAVFGECQALLLNFESLIVEKFGDRHAIRGGLSFTLQFSRGAARSPATTAGAEQRTFRGIKKYIDTFRSGLSTEVQSDLEYSFRVYLMPKIGNHASTDAVAVEFVKYDPTKPEEMKQYEKIVAMIKPKEVRVANRGLLKPTLVASQVAEKLGKRFTLNDHVLCYRHFNVRPSKGAVDPTGCDSRYCVWDELHRDYCYLPAWPEFLADKLKDETTYQAIIQQKKRATPKIATQKAVTTNHS